jgi:hypothetical protein
MDSGTVMDFGLASVARIKRFQFWIDENRTRNNRQNSSGAIFLMGSGSGGRIFHPIP